MTENNFVRMETAVCPICGDEHKHNMGIILATDLENIPENKTCTGYSLCKEHDELKKEYIALIGVKPPIGENNIDTMKLEIANKFRTGDLIHIKRKVLSNIFDIEVPDDTPFIFIDSEVVTHLKVIAGKANA